MIKFNVLLLAVVLMGACGLVSAGQEYSYIDLVNMLVDMPRLATLPADGEVCKQWSSYDRRSKYDEKTGKYVSWDENGDGYGCVNWVRKENGRLVLGEMNGPGCIWRFWVATAFDGKISIYLDGAKEPAVELSCKDFFNCTQEPFNRPNLVHIASEGKNCYVPMSFQKSCKIVADEDYGQYYQFVYTLFTPDTKVPTFKRQLSGEESAALDKVDKKIAVCGPGFNQNFPDSKTIDSTITLKPGEKKAIADIAGTRAITSIVIKKDTFPQDVPKQRDVARELVIAAYWDGQKEPAVWSPLGDFFGTAPGLNKHNSLPVGITNDCLYSNWFMPFEKGGKLVLANEGKTEIVIPVIVTHCAVDDIAKYGRFHAKWHRDAFLPTEPERQIDWTILKTEGKGRFCGVSLEVWNPRGGWWGEGDEKFFVDGEKFPSTFGTGSEDYFGYAWCCDRPFNHAFHNQPLNEFNKGFISNSRWHISDNIPFQKSFEGSIEKYYPNSRPTEYSAVAYWYLSPDGKDEYKSVPVKERVNYYTQLKYPLDVAGIIVETKPVGSVEVQGLGYITTDKWENDDQLWWIGQMGGKIKIAIEAPKKGKYSILTRMTKAADYAIVQWYLDGKKIYEPIDLYNAKDVIATKQINLGKFNLSKGRHFLEVEIIGANPAAIKRYMVGIDYMKVK